MDASAQVRGSGLRAQGSGFRVQRPKPLPAARGPRPAARSSGFTLVEMLVVITIIGILAGLITGAAYVARVRVKKAVAKSDITQLSMALTHYKDTVGEFPPDSLAAANAAAVRRHLRKAFPRYRVTVASGDPYDQFLYDLSHYGKDSNGDWISILKPDDAGPASALAFWLFGLPEEVPATGTANNWKPAGFHADAEHPFKAGSPRKAPWFECKRDRLLTPATVVNSASSSPYTFPSGAPQYVASGTEGNIPYVYFRAERDARSGQMEYAYWGDTNTTAFTPKQYNCTSTNICVPYLEPNPDDLAKDPANWVHVPNLITNGSVVVRRIWRSPDTFQIIAPGLDGEFCTSTSASEPTFRYSKMPLQSPIGSWAPVKLDEGNLDNIGNFSDVTIDDEIK